MNHCGGFNVCPDTAEVVESEKKLLLQLMLNKTNKKSQETLFINYDHKLINGKSSSGKKCNIISNSHSIIPLHSLTFNHKAIFKNIFLLCKVTSYVNDPGYCKERRKKKQFKDVWTGGKMNLSCALLKRLKYANIEWEF